ncbi:hypothetical protein HpVa147_04630 [Helicobacter pylori]
MLLNYDFLEFVDEPQKRNTSLTSAIDKALADKKLARQNKPSVRVLGKAMPLSKFLDAVGDEISRLKYDMSHKTIKALPLKALISSAFIKRLRADYLLGLFQRLDLLKTLFIKTLMKRNKTL